MTVDICRTPMRHLSPKQAPGWQIARWLLPSASTLAELTTFEGTVQATARQAHASPAHDPATAAAFCKRRTPAMFRKTAPTLLARSLPGEVPDMSMI